jgi:hypothetical protein
MRRLEVWPELDARFDAALLAFDRSAEHVAELKELLDYEKRRGILRDNDLIASLSLQLGVAIERMTANYVTVREVHDDNLRIRAMMPKQHA